MLKDTITPSVELQKRALTILGKVSMGLEIVAVDVAPAMMQVNGQPRPVWGIYYQCKGVLLGTMNNVTNLTVIIDPFITDEDLTEILAAGCENMRADRAKQASLMNGKGNR
jgi:hypothetical protein